jgi:hypothetical protein
MRIEPDGGGLLEAAQALLRSAIMPALPPEARHAALMIANAMSIALRQLRAGDGPERDELARLRTLLDDPSGSLPDDPATVRADLEQMTRRLAAHIRSGAADPGTALFDDVLTTLRESTRQRALESAPKALLP